jgi:hypothetical protein
MGLATTSGQFMDCNERMITMTGYSKEQLSRLTIFNLIDSRHLSRCFTEISQMLNSNFHGETDFDAIDETLESLGSSGYTFKPQGNKNAKEESGIETPIETAGFAGVDTSRMFCSSRAKVLKNDIPLNLMAFPMRDGTGVARYIVVTLTSASSVRLASLLRLFADRALTSRSAVRKRAKSKKVSTVTSTTALQQRVDVINKNINKQPMIAGLKRGSDDTLNTEKVYPDPMRF